MLNVRKKFIIFYKVKTVVKKALNEVTRKMITVRAEWSAIMLLNIDYIVKRWHHTNSIAIVSYISNIYNDLINYNSDSLNIDLLSVYLFTKQWQFH